MGAPRRILAAQLVLLVLPAAAAEELRRLDGFSSFTAGAAQAAPAMAATAGTGPMAMSPAMAGAGPMAMPPAMPGMPAMPGSDAFPMMSPKDQIRVSTESSQIVSGMVQEFLHKTKLQPGERKCITEGSGELGGNVGRLAGQLQLIVKKAFGPVLPMIPGVHATSDPIPAQGSPASAGFSLGGANDAAGSISDMVAQIKAQQDNLQQELQAKGVAGAHEITPGQFPGAPGLPATAAASYGPIAGQAAPSIPTGATEIQQQQQQIQQQLQQKLQQAQPQPQQFLAPSQAPQQPQQQSGADQTLDFFYSDGRRLQLVPAMPEPTAAAAPAMPMMPMMGGSTMNAMPVAMEIGFSIRQIVSESHELVGKCVHSDAKDTFMTAGHHMRSLKYMTGHFLANGADVVSELSDSVMAYEHKNLTRFGMDLGKALRKVFLSNSTNGELPEGPAGDEELGNVSTGLLQGFFGRGTYLDVYSERDPSNSVHTDMHMCVQRNLKFFQQVWSETMFMFAQTAASGSPDGPVLGSAQGQMQFGTQLAFTMMGVPGAMKKCGITPEQETMVMDSLKALGSRTKYRFRLPHEAVTQEQMANDFAKTMKAWSELRWEDFGTSLGKLMQESLVKHFSQQYSVDDSGRLRKQLLELEEQTGSAAVPDGASAFAPLSLTMTVLVLLVALVALKSRKTVRVWNREWCMECDRSDDFEEPRIFNMRLEGLREDTDMAPLVGSSEAPEAAEIQS